LSRIPADQRDAAVVLFSAHSIPMAMAANSRYQQQLQEASRLVAEGVGVVHWELAYQSRSGPPQQPWLEPDVCGRIRELHAAGTLKDLIVVPIGFISDHMEVLFDLDTEAKQLCDGLGIHMQRAATAGDHPRFVRMIRELIVERLATTPERLALGNLGPSHDDCRVDCCLYDPQRPVVGM
jgi:ferrochelatase